MMGFAFNLIFTRAGEQLVTFRLIQGAPLVPAFALLIMALFVCPESPRYHLLKGPNFSVEKAYLVLKKVRNTEVIRPTWYATKKGVTTNKTLLWDIAASSPRHVRCLQIDRTREHGL